MKKMILALALTFSVCLLSFGQTQSLSFTRSANTNLSISSTDFGAFSPTTVSFGCKFKRTGVGVHSEFSSRSNGIFNQITSHWSWFMDIGPDDHPELIVAGGPTGQVRLGFIEGANNLRDNLVHTIRGDVDLANPVASERMRLWIDGARVTSFIYTQFPQPGATLYQGDVPTYIGGNSPIGQPQNYYLQGYVENSWIMSGRNPSAGETVDVNSPNVISFIRGDSNPISLDAKSGKLWNNNGVLYGPPLP